MILVSSDSYQALFLGLAERKFDHLLVLVLAFLRDAILLHFHLILRRSEGGR